MQQTDDPRLILQAVRARYNDPATRATTDTWHRLTARHIQLEVQRLWGRLPGNHRRRVLNAGAGGNDFGVCPPDAISLDISENSLRNSPRPVVGNIEALPLAERSIDTILCVGSVINYCDAAAAVAEFSRVLRPRGHLLLEFESSRSAELITQPAFGRSAAVAHTFCDDAEEAVWVYEFDYIASLMKAGGFTLIETIPIQIVSPWVLLLTRSIRVATLAGRLDPALRRTKLLARWASNHLLFCQRRVA